MNKESGTGDTQETLAIVTGASGSVGDAYVRKLSEIPSVRTVAIVRNKQHAPVQNVEFHAGVDLLDAEKTRSTIDSLGCRDAVRILLIHPVGKFKFERQPVADILENLRPESVLTVCGFGSVSDKYDVPFWQSYTKAKNKLRSFLKGLAERMVLAEIDMRSVMVNVSTTDTGNENALRPHADRTFWLKPEKIVEQSLPTLLAGEGPYYQELDIIEMQPGFDPDTYYKNPHAVLEKWKREMES